MAEAQEVAGNEMGRRLTAVKEKGWRQSSPQTTTALDKGSLYPISDRLLATLLTMR